MDSVYLETTIVGHIAGRMHPDPLVAARQQITRDWWQNEAAGFEVFISQVVLEECSHGDPTAAAERLEVVKDIDLLEASDEVDDLANALISEKAVPASEPRDAFHIAAIERRRGFRRGICDSRSSSVTFEKNSPQRA